MSYSNTNIIDKIVEIRKQRGISQQKLSEMTGILQPVIARVEAKRSSPTVEFLAKILDALDLELTLKDSFELPNEISQYVSGLPRQQKTIGRSGDKVFVFDNKYVLKISKDVELLKQEKVKNDWVSEHIGGSKSVAFIEKEGKAYYLRTFIKGHTLEEKRFTNHHDRLIKTLVNISNILRSLDNVDCPFTSNDNKGQDFVHGDLCLPNIIVDEKDRFVGFIDLSNAGKGDKYFDYSWLLWSFEYNLKTNEYNERLLDSLGIKIDPRLYARYVILNLIPKDK